MQQKQPKIYLDHNVFFFQTIKLETHFSLEYKNVTTLDTIADQTRRTGTRVRAILNCAIKVVTYSICTAPTIVDATLVDVPNRTVIQHGIPLTREKITEKTNS